MSSARDAAREVVEQLLEDERLRGDLSDDGYGPLLDWATATLIGAAEEWAGRPADEARRNLEAARDVVRATMEAVVFAACSPSQHATLALLRDQVVASNPVVRSRIAFSGFRLGHDCDANAARLARALRAARPRLKQGAAPRTNRMSYIW